MSGSYRTLRAAGSDEFIVNRSRFIGYASPAKTEEEALAFLESIRQKHRDATHNCYAYIIGQNEGIMRYSDDGEPGGTAGMPILTVMRQRRVVDCAVVVTRYFGGILLGAGGLVRAYTRGCTIGLDAAGVVVMEPTAAYLCEVPYPLWDRTEHALRSLPVQLEDRQFTTAVSFRLLIREKDSEAVLARLTELTDSRIEALEDERFFAAWNEGDEPNGHE